MLEVRGLRAGYGPIEVLHGLSLDVPAGKIVSVIGANGAGKTTLLMTLCGVIRPSTGEIKLDGQSINHLQPEELVGFGVVQVPEGRRVFAHCTVRENLDLGAFALGARANIAADLDKVFSIFPLLKERQKQLAGTLSGGEQQMLAIGRALMARHKLLLLDEPSLGLAPKMVETVFGVIRKINGQGVTIVLVEQNAYMALKLSHFGYVLETGKVILAAPSDQLLSNPLIRKAYLGEV